jgi:hypothetical protein
LTNVGIYICHFENVMQRCVVVVDGILHPLEKDVAANENFFIVEITLIFMDGKESIVKKDYIFFVWMELLLGVLSIVLEVGMMLYFLIEQETLLQLYQQVVGF